MSEVKFVEGVWVDTKETQYGEIVKLSFKVETFIKYLQDTKNATGYVNLDLLSKKDGGKYLKLNDWKPDKEKVTDGAKPANPLDFNNPLA